MNHISPPLLHSSHHPSHHFSSSPLTTPTSLLLSPLLSPLLIYRTEILFQHIHLSSSPLILSSHPLLSPLLSSPVSSLLVQRYYSNISTDFERQQSIDLLLGVFRPTRGNTPPPLIHSKHTLSYTANTPSHTQQTHPFIHSNTPSHTQQHTLSYALSYTIICPILHH